MDPFRVKGKEVISSPFNGKLRVSPGSGSLHRDKRSVSIRQSSDGYFGVTLWLYKKGDGFDDIQVNADAHERSLYLVIEEFSCQTIVLITESREFKTEMDRGEFSDGVFRLPLATFKAIGIIREIYLSDTSIFERMTEAGIAHDGDKDQKSMP